MILAFIPVPTVPENTRPKAKNLPLSDVGTIFEMYIINSPLGSQVLMPNKQKSIILSERVIAVNYKCASFQLYSMI